MSEYLVKKWEKEADYSDYTTESFYTVEKLLQRLDKAKENNELIAVYEVKCLLDWG